MTGDDRGTAPDRLDVVSIADAVNGSGSPAAAWSRFAEVLRRHGLPRAALHCGLDLSRGNPFAAGASARRFGHLWNAELDASIAGFRGTLRGAARPELTGLRPTLIYLSVSAAPLVVEHRQVMLSPRATSVGRVSRQMFEEFGMYHSVILPLPEPGRGRTGMFALWGDEDRPGFRRFARANLAALHMAGHFFTAALALRFPRDAGEPAVLSDRERQVLALHGQGLQTAEVADRLGLSDRSVREYVLRARRKLGAATREAAVARAAVRGWIG